MAEDIYDRIVNGYIDLVRDGGNLKVSMLCDRIDITMSEFYQCYHDIADLEVQTVRETIRGMSKEIEASMGDAFDVNIYIDKGLEVMSEKSERFDFLINVNKKTDFLEHWCKTLVKILKKSFPDRPQSSLEMVAFAVIRGMIYAFNNDMLDDHKAINTVAADIIGSL